MWQPRTEEDIKAGIANGVVRETATFDAKAELPQPGKNKDLAKDICAMTVEGGVLLYGLGGDDPTRPDKPQPFELAGAAERIDQVVQTAIAEPPAVEIYDIASDDEPGKGYLCVVIPASPRAPHMLLLGDNRYWGRGATGNRLLTEGDVSRLYERRARWEVDRERVLSDVIASMPFTFDPAEEGVMVTTVQPVMPERQLLRAAAGDQTIDGFLQQSLTATGSRLDPYPGQGTSGLGDALRIGRAGADVWVCSFDPDLSSRYQARVELTAVGALTYWHSPVVNELRGGIPGAEPRQVVMEQSVTRGVHQALAAAQHLFDAAGFVGVADVAVAVLGIGKARGATLASHLEPGLIYGAPDYRRHDRVTMTELTADLPGVVRRLLDPLFEVISVRDYDPYAQSRFPAAAAR